MSIQIKRVYEAANREDGVRILIDRLWPRGLSKDAAAIDLWLKDCAPSDGLRKWFAHDRTKWDEFKRRYFAELAAREEALEPIRSMDRAKRITLLYSAADTECNNAVALLEYLGMPLPSAHAAARTHGANRGVRPGRS